MTEIWRWKAKNILTGELCTHHHHSRESAMRCGDHIFGADRTEAVRWIESKTNNSGAKKHVSEIRQDMFCGISRKKKKKKTHPYHFYRKSDVRGIVRFDDEDKKT